eukprot:gnl/TRDRNA2_/TRDRNA2_175949_c29_seq2.p1 gnl/TRDRNA2_/TRDRNA2_175949_c29~~gnl/TRDRNA2_/TRDRNA2_175949_c29_seq2.p1  ORF type:complete len:384 (+),score=68.35 gnl/TRDRNA2_/TRDRNA2_175949_c29_seq2:124-1275(+)
MERSFAASVSVAKVLQVLALLAAFIGLGCPSTLKPMLDIHGRSRRRLSDRSMILIDRALAVLRLRRTDLPVSRLGIQPRCACQSVSNVATACRLTWKIGDRKAVGRMIGRNVLSEPFCQRVVQRRLASCGFRRQGYREAVRPEPGAPGADGAMATAAPIECVFFDCDDCLYKNDWKTAGKLTKKIDNYCTGVLGLADGEAYELYRKYGTALRGLIEEKLIEESKVDEFLAQVHDIELDDIQPDPELREIIQAVPHPRWVFTASIREHAVRCLQRLGIDDLFLGVISASSRDMIDKVGYTTKHDPRCFEAAMEFAGVPPSKAAGCVFLDDSVSNLKTAKKIGWRTVLVGLYARDTGALIECPEADVKVARIHDIREAVPDLFVR